MKTKRVLSLALAISMALSLLILPANAASFTDVSGHWAEKLIEQAVAHGYVPAGGAFEPNKAITRNEFARMVNGAFGLTNAASISFSDVPASDPYYKDVQKAVFAGYIAGYEDNTFRGTNLITRQEAAVIIARLVSHPGAVSGMNTLTDASSIAAWAQPAAKIVYTKGYMVGDNLKKFNPYGNLTRAETVKILECILDGENIISGNITINAKNDTIIGKIYTGNLIIADSIDRSSVQLTNCKVLGTLLVNGGGETGVRLSNTGVANMTIDSQWTEPGVAAVGDSTVYNTYLKTTSQLVESNISGMGAGFKNVTVVGTSAKVSLTGTTFDNVAVNTPATLTLTSGKMTNLTIGAAATGAWVKLDAGTNVATATVNAPASFTGKGTVTKAVLNTSGVSFQTQPGTSTTGTGSGTGTSTAPVGTLSYTSTPVTGATKVATSDVINISFEDAIVPSNGQILTNTWVRNNVILRENTSTGTTVDFSATISSNGKVLTIDPSAALKSGTEYLLTVNANAFKGQTNGKANAAMAILFTTDGKSTSSSTSSSTVITDDMEPEFYPGDETDNFPVYGNLTLTFEDKVFDEDGKSLTSSYLKNDVLELRKGSESGTAVSFSASINSAKKVITINPSSDLSKNTTYYLIVNEGTLTNDDKDSNDELVYSFKTANSADSVPLSYPASGTQSMDPEGNFVFEFPSEVYDDDGNLIVSGDVKSAFTIREGSKNGTKITYTVEINKDKDTITLIPDELLEEDETYYVILSSSVLTDKNDEYIPGMTFTYYTGESIVNSGTTTTAGDLTPIEISPEHKEDGVKSSADIKMLFSEDLYTSKGSKATSSYLEDCIEIRKNSESGSKINFTATYNTTYGLDVVELDPSSSLSIGTKYYVIVKANTLFDKNGNANDKFVFYFTVGTVGTSELDVDVDVDEDSAVLTIDYDYSEFDATKAYMTVYYRKDGGTWKTLSSCNNVLLSSNMYGTKTVTLSNLDEDETYEFEVEIELYDGSSYVDTDNYTDTFDTDEYYYYDDSAIEKIRIFDADGNYQDIYAEDFDYNTYDEFEIDVPYDVLADSYDEVRIRVYTYDSSADVEMEDECGYTTSSKTFDATVVGSTSYVFITVNDGGYTTYYNLSFGVDY